MQILRDKGEDIKNAHNHMRLCLSATLLIGNRRKK